MATLHHDWLDRLRPRCRPVCSRRSRQLKGLPYWGFVALFACGYGLLALATFELRRQTDVPLTIWPPAAYGELVLLLLGLKFWPAIALGSLLNTALFWSWFTHPVVALIFMVNSTLQAMLAVWLLLRSRFSPRFDHLRDVGLMVVFGAVIPATVSATLGGMTLAWGTDRGFATFATDWLYWWIGNVNGVFVLFPIVLTCSALPQQLRQLQHRHWGFCWLIGLLALSWFVFAYPTPNVLSPIPLEYLHFPLVAWGAIRLMAPGAATAILMTSGFAYWGYIHHSGPFWLYSFGYADPFVALQTYVCMLVVTALATAATMAEREHARTALLKEKSKSEDLLLNILPQSIAQRLKLTNDTIADHFPAATVLFADLVDFTRLSAQLSPQALVILLNDIFSRFDGLADEYRLEKIKTIGDAYMVVGGIPDQRTDHASAIAAMAIDMQRAIVDFSQQNQYPVKMRIGINTGPVIAGVIGKKKFAYDLWGDTVNIASRMESTGIPGEIQVTRSTYDALKDTYEFARRGTIAVKGRGMVETFLLRIPRLTSAPGMALTIAH
jgi:class 3 adenylate cyclase